MERVAQNNWSPVGLSPVQQMFVIAAVIVVEWFYMMMGASL